MEIFMRNIPFTADETKITLHLEPILHGSFFERYSISPGLPMNFHVFLIKSKRTRGHSGRGCLTLPTENIGTAFLNYTSKYQIRIDNRSIIFQHSNHPPRLNILQEVQLLPYRDPRDVLAEEARSADLSSLVKLDDVQFGWICRDSSFSIEWQWHPWHLDSSDISHNLYFKDATREIVVARHSKTETFTISVRYSRIQALSTDISSEPSILFILSSPPSYEKDGRVSGVKREKLTHLNADHERVAPFTWDALRLVCSSRADLAEFKRLADVADVKFHASQHVTVRRRLFSAEILRRKEEWLRGEQIPWSVAFQCETLHRDILLDTVELLDLRPSIEDLVRTYGADHTVEVLHRFALHLKELWNRDEEEETVSSCFNHAKMEIQQAGTSPLAISTDDARTFRCLHAIFTPTGMTLRGPFTDTPNRILRRYRNHHENFLRVMFTDEDHERFRFDHREVDGPGFIKKRVGSILENGFTLCGRP